MSHGGGLQCSQEGCSRVRKVRGMCAVHGGVNKKKLCGVANCNAKDIGGGLCRTHGRGYTPPKHPLNTPHSSPSQQSHHR